MTILEWLAKGPKTCNAHNSRHRECLVRMLRSLWAKQTEDERAGHVTNRLNGVGFNAYDAPQAGELLDSCVGGDLQVRDAWRAKFLLKKYAKQLESIKAERGKQVATGGELR